MNGPRGGVLQTDVAVVGGGIAGVSVAYELAADRRVVLLEQEDQLAVHTTGRSAAAYLPTYGNATVRALTRASRNDFDALQDRFDTPPLLSPRPLLWVTTQDSPTAHAALVAGGGVRVTMSEAHQLCPVLRPGRVVGAAVADALDVDVMALHGAYVRGLGQRGGTVLRSAAVSRAEQAGGRWRLHLDVPTSMGAGPDDAFVSVVDTEVVVNAAGAWGDRLAAMAGASPVGLQPLRRTIFTTPVDGGHDHAGWPLVLDVEERFYFKPEGPALLVSPGDETPVEPDARGYDDLDVARAMEAVNEATTLGLRRVLAAWMGIRTFAPDRSPVVGASNETPNFFWYVGQGGYGIQMAPALARFGSAVVRGEPVPPDVAGEGVEIAALSPDRFRGAPDTPAET